MRFRIWIFNGITSELASPIALQKVVSSFQHEYPRTSGRIPQVLMKEKCGRETGPDHDQIECVLHVWKQKETTESTAKSPGSAA